MSGLPSPENNFYANHVCQLLASYQRLLGKPLLTGDDVAQQAFNAPFALLSHNTADDPIFNYANHTALNLFELDWQQLCHLPSRLSAEPVNQMARAALLEQVSRNGYIDNYRGIRISRTGRRFQIDRAVVWNVYDDFGAYIGQAACFAQWEWL